MAGTGGRGGGRRGGSGRGGRRLVVSGAREHNLKDVSVDIPRDRLVVFTGLSGSGKSSLAFDTIYAEGQRRYVESLSAYARQFLGQVDKPDVDHIDGLSPAISIDQKSSSRNPRSTVGTVTEVHDYLRLLYARVGVPHDPETGEALERQSAQQIVERVLELDEGTRFLVLAPVVRGRKGTYDQLLEDLARRGFARVRVDGEVLELPVSVDLARYEQHTIEVVVDRLVMRGGVERRLAESVETALGLADGVVRIEEVDGTVAVSFSERLARPSDGRSFEELEPRNFSFNSPYGACADCDGLGTTFEADPALVVPDGSLSVRDGAIVPWAGGHTRYEQHLLAAVCAAYGIDTGARWDALGAHERELLLHGAGDAVATRVRNRFGRERTRVSGYEGVIPYLRRRHREAESDMVRDWYGSYMRQVRCAGCDGVRLNAYARAVTVEGMGIGELCAMPVDEAGRWVQGLALDNRDALVGAPVLREIGTRLGFLVDVGLEYLSLDRAANTLSGGEAQRIRLASQIGSGLTGVLYVLDEPSVGLHQRDNHRLLASLERLRDLGNTVIVVEHDEDTIRAADFVVDIGPGAGELGGEVVHAGTVAGLVRNRRSVTGAYLSGRRRIDVPAVRRAADGYRLSVVGASEHNLRGIDVEIPLGCLVTVTGVSGSGKSTLVSDVLLNHVLARVHGSTVRAGKCVRIDGVEHVDKVIAVDQSPIGRTPRSNPATYTGVFDHIRKLFAQTPEARARGYTPGRFSFNVKGGRCEACAGDGTVRIEMHFLPDVYVPCEVCSGTRYNRDTLEVRFKGRTIAEVLAMPCDEALRFFSHQPAIARHLQTLVDVGLGYTRLGQMATTLSGGEAQRVKLATELSRRGKGHTLYVLDEPTTGLHFDDVAKLLAVLSRLVDAGNTVLVIEHNLDVVKCADWVVDLGPGGGVGGGTVVAEGTPEDVAQVPGSATGQFLAGVLAGRTGASGS